MSLHRRLALTAAASALVLVPTVGHAAGLQAAPQLSDLDRIFAAQAAQANLYEIASGQLAASQARHPMVRALGSRMVADHTAGLQQLRAVATSVNLNLPMAPNAAQRQILRIWSSASGAGFDCAFVPTEYFDHITALRLFTEEANNGTNPALRAYARNSLPVIQAHRVMVDGSLKQIGAC